MKYINAKKLHNGDEIIIKETGETVIVIDADIRENEKQVIVYAQTSHLGYTGLRHSDIK